MNPDVLHENWPPITVSPTHGDVPKKGDDIMTKASDDLCAAEEVRKEPRDMREEDPPTIPMEVTEIMDHGYYNEKALAKLNLSWLEGDRDKE